MCVGDLLVVIILQATFVGEFFSVLLSLNRLFIYLFFFFPEDVVRSTHTTDAMMCWEVHGIASFRFFFRRWKRERNENVRAVNVIKPNTFPTSVVFLLVSQFSRGIGQKKALERTLRSDVCQILIFLVFVWRLFSEFKVIFTLSLSFLTLKVGNVKTWLETIIEIIHDRITHKHKGDEVLKIFLFTLPQLGSWNA